jgi:hypothetical protein
VVVHDRSPARSHFGPAAADLPHLQHLVVHEGRRELGGERPDRRGRPNAAPARVQERRAVERSEQRQELRELVRVDLAGSDPVDVSQQRELRVDVWADGQRTVGRAVSIPSSSAQVSQIVRLSRAAATSRGSSCAWRKTRDSPPDWPAPGTPRS